MRISLLNICRETKEYHRGSRRVIAISLSLWLRSRVRLPRLSRSARRRIQMRFNRTLAYAVWRKLTQGRRRKPNNSLALPRLSHYIVRPGRTEHCKTRRFPGFPCKHPRLVRVERCLTRLGLRLVSRLDASPDTVLYCTLPRLFGKKPNHPG